MALLPRSLKFRMTGVVVLLVLAATVIVTSLSLMLAERDMKSIIGNQQFALLSSAAAHVDTQLSAKRLLLASLAESMPADVSNDPHRLQQFFAQHQSVRKEFLNLIVFDQRGVLSVTAGADVATVPLAAAGQARFERALKDRQSFVSPPFKSQVSGLPAVLMIQPVLNAKGEAVMLLGGSIDLVHSSFLAELGAQKPGKTGFMYMMTAKGILLHHPEQARVLEHVSPHQANDKALKGFEGWTEAANQDGSSGIYSYKRLNAADWIIGARYPVDEAFAPMIAMRRQALLAAAAFAAVAGVAAWLAIQLLLRPLGRLRRNISDIRSGRAGIDVLLHRRQDEIGELSGAFHVLMAEREAAQESIRDSESLISNILERAPDAFVSCDNAGIITKWNAAAEHTFGWSRAEALGRDIADLIIPPDQRGPHHAGMLQFAAGGAGPLMNARVRVTALHRDGHEVPIELSLGALRHGGAYYATAFLHDVTERVAYERQIAASERRVRTIADSMPAMIAYVDRDLRYRFTNEHYRTLMGLDPQAMLGHSTGEMLGQDCQQRLQPYYDAVLRGERVHYERDDWLGGHHVQVMGDMIPDLAADGSVAGFYQMTLDITERKNAELRQAASEQRLKLLTDNLPVLIAYFDQERKFQFANATFFHWFGVEPAALIGHHMAQGVGQDHYDRAQVHLEQAYLGQRVTYELKVELKAGIGGARRTLESTVVPDLREDGSVAGIYALMHDTTHMKEIEERLTHLARIDTLTGIANRLMFEEILQLALGRARRNRLPLALAYLDVDHFKRINDTLGHGAGDAVLKEFALRLLDNVRATDTVARLAGDEFVIIFEQVHNAEEAARLAENIVRAVRAPFQLDGGAQNITTSIGLALHQDDGENAAQLVARADKALYAAKRNGRDGYAAA